MSLFLVFSNGSLYHIIINVLFCLAAVHGPTQMDESHFMSWCFHHSGYWNWISFRIRLHRGM